MWTLEAEELGRPVVDQFNPPRRPSGGLEVSGTKKTNHTVGFPEFREKPTSHLETSGRKKQKHISTKATCSTEVFRCILMLFFFAPEEVPGESQKTSWNAIFSGFSSQKPLFCFFFSGRPPEFIFRFSDGPLCVTPKKNKHSPRVRTTHRWCFTSGRPTVVCFSISSWAARDQQCRTYRMKILDGMATPY